METVKFVSGGTEHEIQILKNRYNGEVSLLCIFDWINNSNNFDMKMFHTYICDAYKNLKEIYDKKSEIGDMHISIKNYNNSMIYNFYNINTIKDFIKRNENILGSAILYDNDIKQENLKQNFEELNLHLKSNDSDLKTFINIISTCFESKIPEGKKELFCSVIFEHYKNDKNTDVTVKNTLLKMIFDNIPIIKINTGKNNYSIMACFKKNDKAVYFVDVNDVFSHDLSNIVYFVVVSIDDKHSTPFNIISVIIYEHVYSWYIYRNSNEINTKNLMLLLLKLPFANKIKKAYTNVNNVDGVSILDAYYRFKLFDCEEYGFNKVRENNGKEYVVDNEYIKNMQSNNRTINIDNAISCDNFYEANKFLLDEDFTNKCIVIPDINRTKYSKYINMLISGTKNLSPGVLETITREELRVLICVANYWNYRVPSIHTPTFCSALSKLIN